MRTVVSPLPSFNINLDKSNSYFGQDVNELYAKFVIARSVLDTFDKGDLSMLVSRNMRKEART